MTMDPGTPALRVLQLPVGFVPWTVGGREVHTDRLSRGLHELSWDVQVAIHQDLQWQEPVGSHERQDMTVHVLPSIEGQLDRSAVYRRLPRAVPGFAKLLDTIDPDIVHFHDFSIGANLRHLRLVLESGIPALLTFHSPGQSCLQTALRYRGITFCDGRIDVVRCTECRLAVGGLPALMARWAASGPLSAIANARMSPASEGRLARVGTARSMTELFVEAWNEMLEGMSALIVHGRWQEEILLLNGARRERIHTIHNGIGAETVVKRRDPSDGPLRLAFVGRCEEVKGPGVLIDAVLSLPRDTDIEVHLYGPYWDTPYGKSLQAKIEGDPRFQTPRPLRPDEVVPTLAEVDLCIVPSTWVEVDPQIVLESFAAGTPVLGSNGYGIAERVRDGVDGILVPAGDAMALASAISALERDRGRVRGLMDEVRTPISELDMAREVDRLYRSLLAKAP